MNRRHFAINVAATAGAAVLGPARLRASVLSSEALPGWSSARAATLLKGGRFRVHADAHQVLELVDIETYRVDDSQYFASFRIQGGPMAEGLYRLEGPGGPIALYLQPRDDAGQFMEAVVCHACG